MRKHDIAGDPPVIFRFNADEKRGVLGVALPYQRCRTG
jgi:hypothetical protein